MTTPKPMPPCWWLLALLVLLLVADAGARKRGTKPPIREVQPPRRPNRPTHCLFGNHTYELEERWRPDLGPPFGVLYCVRCECVPVQRKNRLIAKVKCRNIKNDCPKPSCEDPVLLPERCCKTCPGEDYADLEEDLAVRKLEHEDDDKNSKEFSVLMTGRGLSPMVLTDGAARGYVVFLKRSLHYTIYYAGMERPTSVRFTDDEGSIVEEHNIHTVHHHANSSKICGTWRHVPRIFRRQLAKERLHVRLTTSQMPEGLVAGPVIRTNIPLHAEVFSSLLVPTGPNKREVLGGGGIAIMSPIPNSVLMTINFNGIFTPKDARDVPITVQILRESSDDWPIVSETVTTLTKVHPDFNTVSVRMDLKPSDQQFLAEGKLHLHVTSADGSHVIGGPITPKPTCNVFQAVLSSDFAPAGPEVGWQGASGFAVLNINTDGSITYKLHAVDLSSEIVNVALETALSEHPRRLAEVVDPMFINGWSNGTFLQTSVQGIEMLLAGDLYLNVQTVRHRSELRGRIRQRLFSEAFMSEVPFLLSGGANTTAAGQAWVAVDNECRLHYQVFVAGLDSDSEKNRERHLVELVDVPGTGRYGGAEQKVLQKFDGEEAEDTIDELTMDTMSRLYSGLSYLLVTTKSPGRGKSIELRGKISQVHVPASCLPRHPDDVVGPHDESNSIVVSETAHKCFYEGQIFEDGSQWKAQHDDCMMCSCQRGRVVCHQTMCPTISCKNTVTLSGECCPTCSEDGTNVSTAITQTTRTCYFEGDKRYHAAGSSWHPYIPPFGFSQCAVCRCKTDSLTVECKRITCPVLSCAENEAYRDNPMACCKKCRAPVRSADVPSGGGQQRDEGGRLKTKEEVLSSGGCQFRGHVYANGEEWHPLVQPFGEMKCIRCHCKDGQHKCKRQKCPKLSCTVKIQQEDECCPRCLDGTNLRGIDRPTRRAGRRRKDRGRRNRQE